MSSSHLTITAYDRPLPRPLVTAHGRYERRQGVILALHDETGMCGVGDAAPLPGFSRETITQVRDAAEKIAARLNEAGTPLLTTPDSPARLRDAVSGLDDICRNLPSLGFALETAVADLAARKQGIPLARWLSASTSSRIEVNALLDSSDVVTLRDRARALRAAGFRTFKVKAGVNSVAEDIRRLIALRETVPDARIRVDVNAAWSEADARDAFVALKELTLEFIEQPLAVGNVLPARRLSRDAGIPLALDEEIETPADAVALIEEGMCDVVVLKPMVLGGIASCLEIVAAAQQHRVGVVFTSSWESDIGVAATLHLSAASGPVSRAAGLSTAGAIAAGIVDRPLAIESGHLMISDAPGLGLSLVT